MAIEVLASEDCRGVLFRSPDASPWRLKEMLAPALPGVRLQASAEGLEVPTFAATALPGAELDFELHWSPDASKAIENRGRAKREQPALRSLLASTLDMDAAQLRALSSDFDPDGRLDLHQVANVAVLSAPECFGLCLFDEQGAGKTVSVIYAFDRLAHLDEIDRMLVVAPKSMVPEWKADLERFMGPLYTCRTVSGSKASKRRALRSGADVLITNFETVVSLERELKALLRMGGCRSLLVVDESFLVKTPDAQRTRALRRAREWAGRAFVLCGAPAPNAPTDVVEQISLADFGLAFEGVEVPQERQAALPVVRSTLEEKGAFLRSLKRDVLADLPEKQLQVVQLRFEDRQREAYEAALRSLVLDLEATDEEGFRRELTSFMARRTALLQICSNPAGIVPGYGEVPAKLAALDRLLETWVEGSGEKVVIWSYFTKSLKAIVDRYEGRYALVRYDGSTPVDQRREAVSRFQHDPATKLFVGNPAAAGAGLTLHAARLAVYESWSNQAAHYLQSLDRIHRRGQERPVECTFLVCAGSIEETDLEVLRHKERSAYELLGGPAGPPVTREALLEELLASLSG